MNYYYNNNYRKYQTLKHLLYCQRNDKHNTTTFIWMYLSYSNLQHTHNLITVKLCICNIYTTPKRRMHHLHTHPHTRIHMNTQHRGDWRNLCIRLFGCCCWLSSATNGGCNSGWKRWLHREWFHHWTHAGTSNIESVMCRTEYTTATTGRLVARK